MPHATARRRRGDEPLAEEIDDAADTVDRLLDASWDQHDAPYSRRQLAVGSSFTAGFMIAAGLLAGLAPHTAPHTSWLMIWVLVAAFAIASRVEFPIGAGYAVPTQLFLLPLFVTAPPAVVPSLVLIAQTVAAMFDAATGRARGDRIVDVGVDAWHALAPALVIVLAGSPRPQDAAAWLFVCAFAAQITTEVGVTTLRLWLGSGIPPKLQLRVLVNIWVIDLLLTPIAVIAGIAGTLDGLRGAPLALLGFIALLALLTRDRTGRIDQAHQRLEELRIERSRLEVAVQRIGDAFASKLDLDALLQITMRAAVEALAADGARASALAGPGPALLRRATANEAPTLTPALGAAEQAVAETGRLGFAEVDGVYAVACPLGASGADGQAGVIALAHTSAPFSPRKVALLTYLCEQAGVAAADIARHRTLRRHALTDELTGLANHRRLQEVLAFGVDGYELSGTELALILFDLDDFKQINDTCGHQTGDHVLRSVSDVLRSCCRADDEAARYGGEELAIVMHATAFGDVIAVAERARAAVAALQLVDRRGRSLAVTTSVGVAALGPEIVDPPALIGAADAALYDAKRAGKNRVCAYHPKDQGTRAAEHRPDGRYRPRAGETELQTDR